MSWGDLHGMVLVIGLIGTTVEGRTFGVNPLSLLLGVDADTGLMDFALNGDGEGGIS